MERVDQYRQILKQLKDRRRPKVEIWKEVAKIFAPSRQLLIENYETENFDPQDFNVGQDLFATEAIHRKNLMVDGIFGYMCSPAIEWQKYEMADTELNKRGEVKMWLWELERHMYGVFDRSNFYPEVVKGINDAGTLGTAICDVEEDFEEQTPYFLVRHPINIYIAENRWGRIDTLIREFSITAKVAVETFDNTKLDEEILQASEHEPFKRFGFVHIIHPRDAFKRNSPWAMDFPYASVYFRASGPNTILHEGGYKSFPTAVWRWRVDSNEQWGRSPAEDALWDGKQVNGMSKTMLMAAQRAADPPWQAPIEMKGKYSLRPGKMNYWFDPGRTASPMETGANYPIGVNELERKLDSINKHFNTDFFLMLHQAPREMTATEVIERMGEKIAVLASTIGQMQKEFLERIVERAIMIELESGRAPQPPEVVQGQDLKIRLVGPLAQAQQRVTKNQGVMRGLQQAALAFQINPESADVVDWDETVRDVFESSGMPEKNLLRESEIRRKRQQRAQQQAAMQQQELLSSPNAAKRPEEGSILESFTGQQGILAGERSPEYPRRR